MRQKFETIKCFEWRDFPKEVRDEFEEMYDMLSNDSYIRHYINDNNASVLDNWLLENGASLEEDSKVLILVSW